MIKPIQNLILSLAFISLGLVFAGCGLVAGIFKVGVWFGVIIVVLVIAIIFYILSKVRK